MQKYETYQWTRYLMHENLLNFKLVIWIERTILCFVFTCLSLINIVLEQTKGRYEDSSGIHKLTDGNWNEATWGI